MNERTKAQKLSLAERVTYFSFLPFFVWSFLGGHKQHLLGYNSDNIITVLTAIFCAFYFISHNIVKLFEFKYTAVFGVILFIMLVSGFLSDAPAESLTYVVRHAAYFIISMSIILFFKGKSDLFTKTISASALISSVVVIFSAATLGMGSWNRVTIPIWENGTFSYFPTGYSSSSDPNVLSYFLFLGAIVTVARRPIRMQMLIASAVMVLAGLLTLSRSGAIAFALAIAVVLLYAASIEALRGKAWPILPMICAPPMALMAIYFVSGGTRLRVAAASDTDRLHRLWEALEVITSDPKILLMGRGPGYSAVTIDPHNFYLSTIIDTGILSLLLFLLLLTLPAINMVRNRSENKFLSAAVFIFFCTICMFYWQIRVYYMVFAILALYHLNENSKNAQNRNGHS